MTVLKRRSILTATGLLAGGTLAACAVPAPNPYPPIPALRAEGPPPPRARAEEVFQPGHWHWDGYAYQWVPGRWQVRPVGTARFVPGRWVPRGGSWAWEPAHWAG